MADKERYFSEKEIMLELYDRCVHGSPAGVQFANSIVEFLKEIPAADAVEVVRCSECMMYEENKEAHTGICRRELNFLYAKPDGGCTYGRRKEGVLYGKQKAVD